jgi:hypothetical protein
VVAVRRLSAWRGQPRFATRLVAAFIAAIVLAGGAAPSLYSFGQPHDHFVLGGPPPPNLEHHEHVNPLAVFLGPIGTSDASDNSDDAAGSRLTRAARSAPFGRVVSVSAGASPLVLSGIGIAIAPLTLGQVDLDLAVAHVPSTVFRLLPQAVRSPAPPPPR